MKLSVIITTWHCEPWLEACRASVSAARAACTAETEVIEICDGSGVASARNAGIGRATGDWLLFVDGDDVVDQDYFRRVCELARDADLIRFRLAPFWEGEDYRRVRSLKPFPGGWSACAYSRRVLPPEGFSDCSVGEDNLFLLKCLKRTKRLVDCDAVVYGYRQHTDSTVWRPVTMRRLLDRMSYTEDWFAQFDWRTLQTVLPADEIRRALRLVARDALGIVAIEICKLPSCPPSAWLEHLARLARVAADFPLPARLQLWLCRMLPFRMTRRLIVELPARFCLHFGI